MNEVESDVALEQPRPVPIDAETTAAPDHVQRRAASTSIDLTAAEDEVETPQAGSSRPAPSPRAAMTSFGPAASQPTQPHGSPESNSRSAAPGGEDDASNDVQFTGSIPSSSKSPVNSLRPKMNGINGISLGDHGDNVGTGGGGGDPSSSATMVNSYPSSSFPGPSSTAGPSSSAMPYRPPPTDPPRDAGGSAASAIDLESMRIPTPPPVPYSDKRPICIGALHSRAMMLYPSPAAMIGAAPPVGHRERFHVVSYLGAELLKVKLKVSTMDA